MPTGTVIGLGLGSSCLGALTIVPPPASASTFVVRAGTAKGAAPVPILLASQSGDPTLATGDLVNLFSLSASLPYFLTVFQSSVVAWQIAGAVEGVNQEWQKPQWRVAVAGDSPGTPVNLGDPVQLIHIGTGLALTVNADGSLGLAPPKAACLTVVHFTAASAALPTSWILPPWVEVYFPYWYQPVDWIPGWWPTWWGPGNPSCPWYVPGCPRYVPPPPPPVNPCRGPYPPYWCHGPHPQNPCAGPNPPFWCKPGGDVDGHGCRASAGYRWCPPAGRCVSATEPCGNRPGPKPGPQPKPKPWPPLPPQPTRPGGDADSHGCRASAGYRWCPAKNKCIFATEPCGAITGGDADSHGCRASAGYRWCQEKQSCIPVTESCSATAEIGAVGAHLGFTPKFHASGPLFSHSAVGLFDQHGGGLLGGGVGGVHHDSGGGAAAMGLLRDSRLAGPGAFSRQRMFA